MTGIELLRAISVGTVLALAAAIDLREHRIPDRLVAFGFASSLCLSANLPLSVACGAGTLALFWGVRAASRSGVGMGDVKYAAYLGTVLEPLELWCAVAVASFAALAIGLYRCARSGVSKRSPLPYAPFLSAGCLASQLLHLMPAMIGAEAAP